VRGLVRLLEALLPTFLEALGITSLGSSGGTLCLSRLLSCFSRCVEVLARRLPARVSADRCTRSQQHDYRDPKHDLHAIQRPAPRTDARATGALIGHANMLAPRRRSRVPAFGDIG
jgi:hypothetical protein